MTIPIRTIKMFHPTPDVEEELAEEIKQLKKMSGVVEELRGPATDDKSGVMALLRQVSGLSNACRCEEKKS